MSTPEERPRVLYGTTRKFPMECGNLYVTINMENEKPFEVFTVMGKAGGCTASYTEAIARLASLALRSGVEPEEVIKQLRGIGCSSVCWNHGEKVISCADAIGKALELSVEPEKKISVDIPVNVYGEQVSGSSGNISIPIEEEDTPGPPGA